jgi:hypothetical protein
MTGNTEYFPAELFDVLLGVIAMNSDCKFIGHEYGKVGGYYAVFEFINAHGKPATFETFVGYTKEELSKFGRKGIVG